MGTETPVLLRHDPEPDAACDRLGRPLSRLRVFVTDRCNLRCPYCPPEEAGSTSLPDNRLSFEEIARLARIFAGLGVTSIRLTGGEPLLRPDLPALVAMLTRIPDLEVTLNTNCSLLAGAARALANAGLRRVSVSLDSLDDALWRSNEVSVLVSRVLEGADAAIAAGLGPVRVNVVVRPGTNDRTVLDLAMLFKGSGHTLRLIEYRAAPHTNRWLSEEAACAAIAARVHAGLPLELPQVSERTDGERRYRYRDGGGEIEILAPLGEPSCGDCTRARLSTEGVLYACLFARAGWDLRTPLRQKWGDDAIASIIRGVWLRRDDSHAESRGLIPGCPRLEMPSLGP
jgi:cyclic pyranopterin phosphate synthase